MDSKTTNKFNKRIAAMSDLHGYLPTVEPCDIVCIAGDIFPLKIQSNKNLCGEWFIDLFLNWVNSLIADKVILVPGNHDYALLDKKFVNRLVEMASNYYLDIKNKFVFLSSESYSYDGIRFFGEPHIIELSNWAFYTPNPKETYSKIEDCDILISHMPPYIGGVGSSYYDTSWRKDYGSFDILEAVSKLPSVKYWFCGHVHSGNHEGVKFGDIMIYNVSLIDERYIPYYKILYLDI